MYKLLQSIKEAYVQINEDENIHFGERINNSSEAVQLSAVKNHRHLLVHIKNPSEAVQLAAVKQNPPSPSCETRYCITQLPIQYV